MMTSFELKCKRIYEVLSKMPECVENLGTKEFHNLERFGIRFKLAPGTREDSLRKTAFPSEEARQAYIEKTKDGYETLSSAHFCCSSDEFLPNGYLYWRELENGEYEKIVNALYEAVV